MAAAASAADASALTDEQAALAAIYGDEALTIAPGGSGMRVELPEWAGAALELTWSADYPSARPPAARLTGGPFGAGPAAGAAAGATQALLKLYEPGEVVIYTWVEALREQLAEGGPLHGYLPSTSSSSGDRGDSGSGQRPRPHANAMADDAGPASSRGPGTQAAGADGGADGGHQREASAEASALPGNHGRGIRGGLSGTPPAHTGLIPGCLRETAGGVRINVHAKPGAKQGGVLEIGEEALEVAIDAPAREGEANAALLELLARALGLKRRALSLISGGKARDKLVHVEGLSLQEVHARLRAALP